MSESQKTHTGSCLCGAVHYTISGDPMMAGHCHCIDCRKSAGTGHIGPNYPKRWLIGL